MHLPNSIERLTATAIALAIFAALISALAFAAQIEGGTKGSLLEIILVILLLATGCALVYVLLTARQRARLIARRMQKDLVVENEQLKALYHNSPVPYLLTWPDGTIENPNLAAIRLFQTTPEKLTSQNFFAIWDTAAKPQQGKEFQELLRRGVPVNQQELQIIQEKGSYKWVLLSIFPVRTSDARRYAGLVTLVDITAQKDLERAKTEFVSLTSHQLRTPLTAIKWHAELLMEHMKTFTNLERDHVEKIATSTEEMIELVRTLLNISRIELGTLKIEPEPIDLNAIGDDVIESMHHLIVDGQLNVEKQFGRSNTITTDPGIVRVIVENLVSNAVKYTPAAGTITVKIKASRAGVEISVTDSGIGIPNEEKQRIFEKLFRASNAKRYRAPGSGLGLYLSRQLAVSLGGSIEFSSELGQGTTFTVWLPKSIGPQRTSLKSAEPEEELATK
jgi:PAS domain S-box-containing protein